eukprot:gene3193-13210_t
MFGLMNNLYHWVQKKREKRVTLILIGLDNAGKTTLLNTVQGELAKETAPTMGFNPGGALSMEGRFSKYSVQVFDLGGGSRIRKIWKTYFAEVHGVIFVVDSSDKTRFEEQDLPDVSKASDIENILAVTSDTYNSTAVHMVPCVAKCGEGQPPDARLRDGISWLMSQIDSSYGPLRTKVEADMEEVRHADLRKKLERDKRVQAMREERERQAQLAEEAEAANSQMQGNALAALPNQIMSPGKEGPTAKSFSDINSAKAPELKSRLSASSANFASPATELPIPPSSSSRPTSAAARPGTSLGSRPPLPPSAAGTGVGPHPLPKGLPSALPDKLPPSEAPLNHLAAAISNGSVVHDHEGVFRAPLARNSFNLPNNKVAPEERVS